MVNKYVRAIDMNGMENGEEKEVGSQCIRIGIAIR
jgi:hypothetical protein